MNHCIDYETYIRYFKESLLRMSDEELDDVILYLEERISDLEQERIDFITEKTRRNNSSFNRSLVYKHTHNE